MQFLKTAEVSLSDATKPLLIISRLAGMNPKTNWHKIYPVLILIFDVIMLCWIWLYHASRRFSENYYFSLFVHFLQNLCRIVSIFIILGTGLIDRKRFMVPLKDFVHIDQSLKKLGGCLKNRGGYRLELLLFACIGLMPLVVLLVYNSLHLWDIKAQTNMMYFMGWFHNLTIMIVCAIADCCFSSTLSIISTRFRAINLIIHRSGTNTSYLSVNFLEISRVHTENDVLRDLKILRKQYHYLWRIANRVNEAYGLHLLVGATTSLTVITSKLWEVYVVFVSSNPSLVFYASGMSWVLFSIARMILLAQACDATVTEAKVTYVALQELWMKGDHNPQIKTEMRDFFTQLQLEVRSFTACGFFNIDYTLVCAILGAACTYLVILIQMGHSDACAIIRSLNESAHHEDRS